MAGAPVLGGGQPGPGLGTALEEPRITRVERLGQAGQPLLPLPVADDGEPLECCESDWPSKALVSEGSTREIGVPISPIAMV